MTQVLKQHANACVIPLSSHLKIFHKKKNIKQLVMCFALQLMRHDGELDLSNALVYAWDEMKDFGHLYKVVAFENAKGQLCKRVVMVEHWSNFYQVKGTGQPLSKDRIPFADAAKLHCGINPIFAPYKNKLK